MANNRLGYIDAIRGFAAVSVVYFHTAEYAHKRHLVSSPLEDAIFTVLTEYFDLGKIAVVAFFAVSGFVIPFSLLRPQHAPLRSFAVSRFLRLYPAYWLSLALAVIFLFWLPGTSVDLKRILANTTMFQALLGQEDLLGVYWTLLIELIFYIISAIMFFFGLLNRPNTIFWTSIFFIACALAMGFVRFILVRKMPVAIPLAISVMFWGLYWRYHLERSNLSCNRTSAFTLTGILLSAIPIISIFAYNFDQGFNETWYRYTLSYYTGILTFMLLSTRLKVHNVSFVTLGRISYSFYLLGPIVQILVQNAIGRQNLASLPIHAVILVVIAATYAAASASYLLIELPAQRLAKQIIQRSTAAAFTR